MIHDSGDGGRTVWEIAHPDLPRHVFVIAASASAALDWLARMQPGIDLERATTGDRGSADRTEIALWRDDTRLPGTAPGGGSAP
jgi:hypothetical protein